MEYLRKTVDGSILSSSLFFVRPATTAMRNEDRHYRDSFQPMFICRSSCVFEETQSLVIDCVKKQQQKGRLICKVYTSYKLG